MLILLLNTFTRTQNVLVKLRPRSDLVPKLPGNRVLALKWTLFRPRGGGGGALPSNRLMGMCRWMGSHFHVWIDYNGVAFSIELL